MGNDIKLPVSRHREAQELQIKSQNQIREQLNSKIWKVSGAITATNRQIDQIESNLEQLHHNIDYYQAVITQLSIKLDQTELEQINATLVCENYTHKAKEHLHYLSEVIAEPELSDDDLDYSNVDTADLENKVQLLNAQVAQNEERIVKMIQELTFT